jgi:hypothetical protein
MISLLALSGTFQALGLKPNTGQALASASYRDIPLPTQAPDFDSV